MDTISKTTPKILSHYGFVKETNGDIYTREENISGYVVSISVSNRASWICIDSSGVKHSKTKNDLVKVHCDKGFWDDIQEIRTVLSKAISEVKHPVVAEIEPIFFNTKK